MRKLALGALMLFALVAPLGFAATSEAALRPVKLRLIALTCVDTEDAWWEDEVEIVRNGTPIYGPQGPVACLEGTSLGLETVPLQKFRRSVTIDLWERDFGLDPHDHLGTVTINRNKAGRGPQTVTLSGGSYKYILKYQVVR